jgi:hypothetical protein
MISWNLQRLFPAQRWDFPPESPRKDHPDQAAHWIVPAQQGQDFAGWNPGGADFLPVGGCIQQLWICRKNRLILYFLL